MEKRCVRASLADSSSLLGASMSAALILSWLCLQTPGSQTGPELTSRVVRRLREQLEQVLHWSLASIAASRYEHIRTGQTSLLF